MDTGTLRTKKWLQCTYHKIMIVDSGLLNVAHLQSKCNYWIGFACTTLNWKYLRLHLKQLLTANVEGPECQSDMTLLIGFITKLRKHSHIRDRGMPVRNRKKYVSLIILINGSSQQFTCIQKFRVALNCFPQCFFGYFSKPQKDSCWPDHVLTSSSRLRIL